MVPYFDDNVSDTQRHERYVICTIAIICALISGVPQLALLIGVYALCTAIINWDPIYALLASITSYCVKHGYKTVLR